MKISNRSLFIAIAILLAGCGRLPPAATVNTPSLSNNAGGSIPVTSSAMESPTVQDQDRNFFVSEALRIKLYLIDKYDPGICQGKPKSLETGEISDTIGADQTLSKFIKQYYGLESDLDIYQVLIQLNRISLQTLPLSKYHYKFTDGQCCQQIMMEGEASSVNFEITDELLSKEIKFIPC